MPKIKAQSVEIHRQNQLQVLVDSSIGLIIKNGFHSLKFEDVAKKSKISRTTVYEYFNSKEDIAIAIAKQQAEALGGQISYALIPGAGTTSGATMRLTRPSAIAS